MPTSQEAEAEMAPLFTMRKQSPRRREKAWWVVDATRTRYTVTCPGHDHRVGIITFEGHLVYRHHVTKTYAGITIECSNSLRRVCELPESAERPDVRCAHQVGVPR